MPISKKILKHLEKNKVSYTIVPHKKVYTAYDLAGTLKEDLKKIAKTLLVKADKSYYLVVVPARYQLDFGKIKKGLKAKKVEIVAEQAMLKILKSGVGAITPFGSLEDIQVLLDKTFFKVKEMIVGAGTFTDSLKIKVKDFLKVEEPLLLSIGVLKKVKKVKKQIKKVVKKPVKKLRRKK